MCFEAPRVQLSQLRDMSFCFEEGGFPGETALLEDEENSTLWNDFFIQNLDMTLLQDVKHLNYVDPSFTGPLGIVSAGLEAPESLFQVKKSLLSGEWEWNGDYSNLFYWGLQNE